MKRLLFLVILTGCASKHIAPCPKLGDIAPEFATDMAVLSPEFKDCLDRGWPDTYQCNAISRDTSRMLFNRK